MNIKSGVLFFLLLIFPTLSLSNTETADNIFFIGLSTDKWHVYLKSGNKLRKITAIKQPRSASFNKKNKKIAFVSSSGDLKEYDVINHSITHFNTETEKNYRYTLPNYSADNNILLAVRLPEGRSRRTDLVSFQSIKDKERVLVRKRTAQFDPVQADKRYMYYTTASCVNDCGKMIWDLWRLDRFTGIQDQITLGNSVSRQPIMGNDGWLYFSSNRQGNYHIWRMKPQIGAKAEQLTTGDVRDTEPALDKDNVLYFIRKNRNSTKLMKRLPNATLLEINLPAEIEDIRELEIR